MCGNKSGAHLHPDIIGRIPPVHLRWLPKCKSPPAQHARQRLSSPKPCLHYMCGAHVLYRAEVGSASIALDLVTHGDRKLADLDVLQPCASAAVKLEAPSGASRMVKSRRGTNTSWPGTCDGEQLHASVHLDYSLALHGIAGALFTPCSIASRQHRMFSNKLHLAASRDAPRCS